ncbi:hypothetical protein JCM8097_000923 [Rhodosporidiobolus ruineniae]
MFAARQTLRAVRTYATEAAAKHVQLPAVQLHGLAGKYAGALFTAAAKSNALQAVEADLKGVKSISADATVRDFLSNPILSTADRASGIDAILKKSSPKGASDLTKNFFAVLAENGRLYEAEKAIDNFIELMSAHRGEVKITVTSAVPLEKDLQKRLEETLKGSKAAAAGKSVVFDYKVQESQLGGIYIDFGDKSIDLSVSSKVSRLNAQLQESI